MNRASGHTSLDFGHLSPNDGIDIASIAAAPFIEDE
jgi:hypothetical protein